MQADWDKLAGAFKNSRSLVIAEVDCTQDQGLCGKHGVSGYPTIVGIKKGASKGEKYNGGRDFNSFKRYADANLAGPECSLEDKDGCTKEELKILEESEAMSTSDRRAKIQELEAQMKQKKEEAKKLEAEAKEEAKKVSLYKLGGEKPDKVEQLLGDAEFREKCESRTCVLCFLPHIFDGGAAARNNYLKIIDTVFKKTKADGQPVGFMWLQGGDQYEIEEKLALQFGFPAVIAVNLKKERFGVMRGSLDKDGLSGFINSMMLGRVPLSPLPKGLPKWGKTTPWDGKDGELPVEEEL